MGKNEENMGDCEEGVIARVNWMPRERKKVKGTYVRTHGGGGYDRLSLPSHRPALLEKPPPCLCSGDDNGLCMYILYVPTCPA